MMSPPRTLITAAMLLAVVGAGSAHATDATQTAWVSQSGAETALAYAGGSGQAIDDQGQPYEYHADPAASFGGFPTGLTTPGAVVVRFGAEMQSASFEDGNAQAAGVPLPATRMDSTRWKVTFDHSIADGRFLRVHASPSQGEERFWVATFDSSLAADPPRPALALKKVRRDGRSIRFTVSSTRDGTVVSSVRLKGRKYSKSVRSKIVRGKAAVRLRIDSVSWRSVIRGGTLVLAFTGSDKQEVSLRVKLASVLSPR